MTGCTDDGDAVSRDGEGGALTIYAYEEFPSILLDAITGRFESTRSADVSIESFADPEELLRRLLDERDDPRADLVIGLDSTSVPELTGNDLLAAYRPQNLSVASQSLIVDSEYRAVPVAYGGVGLVYDTRAIADPPRSFEALLEPRFESSLLLLDPKTSLTGRHFMLFAILELGESGYREFLERLEPSIMRTAGTLRQAMQRFETGTVPLIPGYEATPARLEKRTSPGRRSDGAGTLIRYRNAFIEGKAYARIEIAGIVNGAPDKRNAERCIEYLVSADFQKLIPANHALYPVRPGIDLPYSLDAAGRAERMVKIGESSVSANIDRWLEIWEEVLE